MRPTLTKVTVTDVKTFKTRKGAENAAVRDRNWDATRTHRTASSIEETVVSVDQRGPKEFVLVWTSTVTLSDPGLHTPCSDCGVSVPTVLAGNGDSRLPRCTDGTCHRVSRDAYDEAVRYEKAMVAFLRHEGGWDVVSEVEDRLCEACEVNPTSGQLCSDCKDDDDSANGVGETEDATCWVAGCSGSATYSASNPAARLLEPVTTCSAHLGDLLGNAAKSTLTTSTSVALRVETLA